MPVRRVPSAVVLSALRSNPVLRDLPVEALSRIGAAPQRVVDKGGVLVRRAEADGISYVALTEGLAISLLPDEVGVWRQVPRGAVIGFSESLLGQPHLVTVFARTRSVVLVVHGAAWLELFSATPALYPRLLHALAQRVDELLRIVHVFLAGGPRERVEVLLRAAAGPDGTIALSLTALAQQANTTRETVSRTVASLVKRGVLRRNGPRLRLT